MRTSVDYPPEFARYDRQMRYPPLGVEGQRRLAAARVLMCGCGALGSMLADTLVRAGVGRLRLVDRDFLETSNLQRQSLFDEQDVAEGLPKAMAAAAQVAADQFRGRNRTDRGRRRLAQHRAAGRRSRLILDGTDNFETRYPINDLAVRESIPWVFGGVIGAEGQTMTIIPGETGCLRCLMQRDPAAGQHAHLRHGRHCARAHRGRDRLDYGARGDQNPQRKLPSDQPLADRRRPVGQPLPANRPVEVADRMSIARRASNESFLGCRASAPGTAPYSVAATRYRSAQQLGIFGSISMRWQSNLPASAR